MSKRVTERTTLIERIRQVFEPAIRRVLHTYWRFSRGMTLGVRGLVIDEANRVFLVKHSYVSGWHLPGGGVEPNETMIDALIRELARRGQYRADRAADAARHLLQRPRFAARPRRGVSCCATSARPRRRCRTHEIIAHGFFKLDELPNDTTAGTRARIIEVMGRAPVSERW